MCKNLVILFSIPPLLCLYWSIYFLWGDLSELANFDRKQTLMIMFVNLGIFPLLSLLIAYKLKLISEYLPKRYNKDLVIIYLMMGIFLFWSYYISRYGKLWPEQSLFPKLLFSVLVANCLALPISRIAVPDLRLSALIIGLVYLVFSTGQNLQWLNLVYIILVLAIVIIIIRGQWHKGYRQNIIMSCLSAIVALIFSLIFSFL